MTVIYLELFVCIFFLAKTMVKLRMKSGYLVAPFLINNAMNVCIVLTKTNKRQTYPNRELGKT